ncbi:MAG: hypothetical protein RBU30_04920 [Polyangia bacterium]|jgi:cysteine-rich repeat protein|nr:hypothetical protein [Polyangia bacterium]
MTRLNAAPRLALFSSLALLLGAACGHRYSSTVEDAALDSGMDDAQLPDARPDAVIPDTCRDGILDPGEDCDDGNGSAEDYCLPNCRWACGDGVVNSVEICDPGVPAGQEGACPSSCDDQDACTSDTLMGAAENCDATCVHGDITLCQDVDGCCPSGCNANTDSDCQPICGNGVLETGEHCDPPGACPSGCDDNDVCTADSLLGSASDCTARCVNTVITACANGDGCCPSGCDATNDGDCNRICNNGVVEPGETCDPPSSCPTSCNDNNACTTDSLQGSASQCTANCVYTAIVNCVSNDGCCPSGCNANNDNDCTPTCDNGVVEPGETCDPPGSCPMSCDDNNACTTDSLEGDPSLCTAVCAFTDITSCADNDGCCPSGCNSGNDNDCSASCGNDYLDPGETCDPPTTCPTSCNDNNVCTTDTLQGSAANCDALCVFTTITACAGGDGCCPSGCNANNDSDCPVQCDNGVTEPGETCDPISTCPTSCNDNNSCTADALQGDPNQCTALCVFTPITDCTSGDGCCPDGCNATNDNDCSAVCGNEVVEPGEYCDPVSSCPTSCNDNNFCTTDSLQGSAANCTARCVFTQITTCGNNEGCCPSGCNANNDPDCTPYCGNNVIESGEQCDDGNQNPGDGCSDTCQIEILPTAFRASDLDLKDPHIYVSIPLFGCSDITNSVPFGLADPINTMLQNAVQTDGNGNGLLDLSLLMIFRPLTQTVPGSGPLDVGVADCTPPMAGTTCQPDPSNPLQATTFTNGSTAPCIGAYPGTLRPYTPALTTPALPCFSSGLVTLTVDMGGILIPLQDVQVGATYVGNPATSMANTGVLRGFLSEANAATVILPADMPLVGGQPMSSILPGGTGCCASHDARDYGLDGTTRGWWFYFNFPATRVTWIEP